VRSLLLSSSALFACTLSVEGSGPPAQEVGPAQPGHDASDEAESNERPEAIRPQRDAAIRLDAGGSRRFEAGAPSAVEAAADVAPMTFGEAGLGSDAAQTPGEAGCQLEGNYALRTEVDISWDGWTLIGLPILSPGEGVFTMDAVSILHEADKRAEVIPCNITIPDEIWDRPSIPRWNTTWGSSCAEPGCKIFTGPLAVVFGARVTGEPFTWPGARGERTNFQPVDDDSDGLPGVTLIARGPTRMNAEGRSYSYPPLVVSLFARARKIMMAMGMHSQIEGTISRCGELDGVLTDVGAYGRTLGCLGMRGTEEFVCSPDDVQFLDENMPVWKVRSAKFRSVRVQDANCAAVHAALGSRAP
jgi:hypothetical protein